MLARTNHPGISLDINDLQTYPRSIEAASELTIFYAFLQILYLDEQTTRVYLIAGFPRPLGCVASNSLPGGPLFPGVFFVQRSATPFSGLLPLRGARKRVRQQTFKHGHSRSNLAA